MESWEMICVLVCREDWGTRGGGPPPRPYSYSRPCSFPAAGAGEPLGGKPTARNGGPSLTQIGAVRGLAVADRLLAQPVERAVAPSPFVDLGLCH